MVRNWTKKVVNYFTLQFLIVALFLVGCIIAVFVFQSMQRTTDKQHLEKVITTDHSALIQTQINSCIRGNKFRFKVNTGFTTIRGYITLASEHSYARAMKETGAARAADIAGAKAYKKIAESLEPVTQVKCQTVIEDTNKIINQTK